MPVCALAHAASSGKATSPSDWVTAVAAVGVAVLLACLCVLALKAAHRGDDEGEDSGGGGGSVRPPRPPDQGPGGGDPEWWPEFERHFRAYARGIERRTRSSRVRS